MPLATADTSVASITERPDPFDDLYRQHAPRLFALAARMCGSREQAEDLLQEIFLQAFRKLDSFKGESSVGTWLYRLAINHCLDFVRSRQGRMSRMMETLDEPDARQPAVRPACAATRIDLERTIEQLPDGCRAAFILHDVEGFDHKEVAGMLGVAEGTSKSQVFKARMKLRAILTS